MKQGNIKFKDVLIMFLVLSTLAVGVYALSVNNEMGVLKNVIHIDTLIENKDAGVQAENYYTLASEYYDVSEYTMVITNCEISRDYATEYMQELREVKIKVSEMEGDIFEIYSDIIGEEIYRRTNLYEACEYFESASRSYNVGDYDLGDKNIEEHNVKIANHDESVERFNNLLAQYSIELKELSK